MRGLLTNVTGFVYFIQMDRIGPIKIGFATNVFRRLAHLQTASPYQLNLLAYFAGTREDENMTQNCLRESNIRGEWFHPTEKVLGYVESGKLFQTRDEKQLADGYKILGDFRIGSEWWNSEPHELERSLN